MFWFGRADKLLINELKSKIIVLEEKILKVEQEKKNLQYLVNAWKQDYEAQRVRLLNLQRGYDKAITLPDIKSLTASPVEVNPWNMHWPTIDVKIADKSYYTWSKANWINILARIWPEVKKARIRYKSEISDCDNWATTMYDFATIAFLKAGLSKQGALMTIWSYSHAFNAFIDNESKVWLYEPQNDTLKGLMNEGTDTYLPARIWFAGESIL